MQYIVLVVLLIIIVIVIKYKKQSISSNSTIRNRNSEYDKYYNSVNRMSYEELEQIHNELLPLCNEITFVMIPHADSNGDPVYDSREVTIQKLNQKRAEILSPDKQIYGCKTYDDADKLNQAIVKRLDELDEE